MNRVTQMSLVGYYSAFFQDPLPTPHISNVHERIGPDHNQVGKLALLHCAQFGADAAHLSATAWRRREPTAPSLAARPP